MLDHVTLGVSDFDRSRAFYDRALAPLAIERPYAEGTDFAGYGRLDKAFFWIGLRRTPQTGVHVAFAALDRETVDSFHAAALAAATTARLGCVRTTIRTTMARLSLLPTATPSRRPATIRSGNASPG